MGHNAILLQLHTTCVHPALQPMWGGRKAAQQGKILMASVKAASTKEGGTSMAGTFVTLVKDDLCGQENPTWDWGWQSCDTQLRVKHRLRAACGLSSHITKALSSYSSRIPTTSNQNHVLAMFCTCRQPALHSARLDSQLRHTSVNQLNSVKQFHSQCGLLVLL